MSDDRPDARAFQEFLRLLNAGELEMPPEAQLELDAFPHLGQVAVNDVAVHGPGGTVSARLYRGPGAPSSALVWVHGGGFISGDLDMPEAHWVALELAAAGIATLSVDYRKAVRGVHHPAPLDDVSAAWAHATGHARHLFGVPPSAVHLGGASAGAALVAALALRLRDHNNPLPASLALVYPLLHPEIPAASDELRQALSESTEPQQLGPEITRLLAMNYVGSTERLADPTAFAGLVGDLQGLPPTYLLSAEYDALRASSEQFARQLHEAHVPVQVKTENDAPHGYLNTPTHPAAQHSIKRLAHWLIRSPHTAVEPAS